MRLLLLAWCAIAAAPAAPVLRLSNSVAGPVAVALGSNPPPQTIEASNAGDGALSLTLTVEGGAPWLGAEVGAAGSCATPGLTPPCYPLRFYANTAGLQAGTYTGLVTVADRHAIDAPQVIAVVVQVGTADSPAIERYLPPGGSASIQLVQCCPTVSSKTDDGGTWLALVLNGVGTIRSLYTYFVRLAPPASMASGTYHGSVTVDYGAGKPSVTPVTLRVTTQPIAAASPDAISVRLAERGPPSTAPFLPPIVLANSGLGTLSVSAVTASGPGLAAYNDHGVAIVTADPGALPPGRYDAGVVTIECNAANCPVRVPVHLEIVPRGAPVIEYRGVVDNATFVPGAVLAPGEIVVVKGDQLSLRPPEYSAAPLATSLGGATVLVNDVLAPLYYASYGQIAFRIPSSTATGTARVQVIRDGLASNVVSVNLIARAPHLLALTRADGQLVDAAHPARAGDVLIVWAIGLGPTDPPVDDAALPSSLERLTETPAVDFGGKLRTLAPVFAGLSGGAIGVYQVNVVLPADFAPGSGWVLLRFTDAASDSLPYRVE